MLVLINTNTMRPPIAPIGLDYVAGSARQAGIQTDVLDLCLAQDPGAELESYFSRHEPTLVGITFRNSDDSFWPGGEWFVPKLAETVGAVRKLTEAPIVLGGVGFSIFPEAIVKHTGAEFGVHGDGEEAIVTLLRELEGQRRFERVGGLIWREDGGLRCNPPCWPNPILLEAPRDAVDNFMYFRKGGQVGIETKRGCNRRCIYCADPLAKGMSSRARLPSQVADEMECLLLRGIDVLHLCDSEFNIPIEHARAVCEEIIRRGLPKHVRWYAYLAAKPFDAALASLMCRAGCVGINFTVDSASEKMLATYRQPHRQKDLRTIVEACRENGISVMTDLLLGGPGETPETAAETIRFFKEVSPDCVGAALGVRIYPETAMARIVEMEGPLEKNPSIRRAYEGRVDLFRPTFYISHALGERPAQLVRDLIAGDERFFEPRLDGDVASDSSHNYNQNARLLEAIAGGARGAYWDILRRQKICKPHKA